MRKCDYCGQESGDEAAVCAGCGTAFVSRPPKPALRPMNAQDRKRAWRALRVAVACAVAAWLFAWKVPGRWDFIKDGIVVFGLVYAVEEMMDMRKARTQPEPTPEKKD